MCAYKIITCGEEGIMYSRKHCETGSWSGQSSQLSAYSLIWIQSFLSSSPVHQCVVQGVGIFIWDKEV